MDWVGKRIFLSFVILVVYTSLMILLMKTLVGPERWSSFWHNEVCEFLAYGMRKGSGGDRDFQICNADWASYLQFIGGLTVCIIVVAGILIIVRKWLKK